MAIKNQLLLLLNLLICSEPREVSDLQASFSDTSDFNATARILTVNLTITWTEPMYPNGEIQSYEVAVYIDSDTAEDDVYNDSSIAAPNVTVQVEVMPYTNYTVRMVASTSAGQGDPSTVVIQSPQAGVYMMCVCMSESVSDCE